MTDVRPDLSKCQCDAPGFCEVFKKQMGENPPNWKWCQEAHKEQREQYLDANNKGLRIISKASSNSEVDVVNFYDEIQNPTSNWAICVIPANELANTLLDSTRASIKDYAEKCGADYIELTGNQYPEWPMANKYRLHSVAKTYKKTLYLDCDVLIKRSAPNIFKETPDDKISAYDEFSVWEAKKEMGWIAYQQEVIVHKVCSSEVRERWVVNGKLVAKSMINGGVMVIPQSCADYYKQPEKAYPKQWCFDQNYLTLTLPEEKFHPLDAMWNLEYVDEDSFWYFLPDAHFVHVNSLGGSSGYRKSILEQINAGDYTKCEKTRFDWYENSFPQIVEDKTAPHNEKVCTDTFKNNRIGIVFNNLTPGGATTWLEGFVECFRDDITGIFAVEDHPKYNDLTLGIRRGFSLDELYELYVKSDVMLYWLYTIPSNLEYFPDFIWKNPLNKKIIFMSHSSLRVNSHDLLIEMLSPDVSVFVSMEASRKYNGIYIPPMVQPMPDLERNPVPKNILWHHRLERNKGVEVLRQIREILPDFNFHICGSWIRDIHDDATIGYVEDEIIHSCRDNVFYHGHVEDMRPFFESCSVSLSTSFDESFGLSVAESIINGIPTVSHSTGVGSYSDRVVRYGAHASEWAKEIRLCEATTDVAKNKGFFTSRFSVDQFQSAWKSILEC